MSRSQCLCLLTCQLKESCWVTSLPAWQEAMHLVPLASPPARSLMARETCLLRLLALLQMQES